MGNAPLPRPPAPTERKVVIPITTTSKYCHATELILLSPVPLPTLASDTENASETVASDAETGAHQPRRNNNTHNPTIDIPMDEAPPDDYPPQLLNHSWTSVVASGFYLVPPEDYQTKMQALQTRLHEWKGGRIRLGIGIFSVMVVLGLIIALTMPSFLNEYAVLVLPAVIPLVIGYAIAFRKANQATDVLIEDVQDMFWSWKRTYGIRVSLRRVSHWTLPIQPWRIKKTNGRKKRIPTETRTTNCFCLVMAIVGTNGSGRDESADLRPTRAGDDISLGTVDTNGSDES